MWGTMIFFSLDWIWFCIHHDTIGYKYQSLNLSINRFFYNNKIDSKQWNRCHIKSADDSKSIVIQIFSSTFKYGRNWNRFYIWLIQIDFYQLMLLLLLFASEKLLYIFIVNDVSNLKRWNPTRRNKSLEWFVHAVVDKVLSWKQTIERKTTISKIWPNCIFFSLSWVCLLLKHDVFKWFNMGCIRMSVRCISGKILF